jgi:phosphoglycerate dehydrogenase-like enzyme
VLILGAGGVGQALAKRLAGFEVEVTMVARTERNGVVSVSELPDVLPLADIVVVAVPLTAETERMVDAEFLASMRSGSLLVNVSRGAVVDTEALLAEVEAGRLRASLDVTDPEPLPSTHPLWTAPGVLMTPHLGGNTSAYLPRARRLVARQVRAWRSGARLDNIVFERLAPRRER